MIQDGSFRWYMERARSEMRAFRDHKEGKEFWERRGEPDPYYLMRMWGALSLAIFYRNMAKKQLASPGRYGRVSV